MKTTFKKSVLAFLTCVLALAFALTGCSGGGKDPKANFVGSWQYSGGTLDGEELTDEYMDMLKEWGLNCILILDEDGTGVLDMFLEVADLKWEAKDATTVTITAEDESHDLKLKDDKLVLEVEGDKIIFTKSDKDLSGTVKKDRENAEKEEEIDEAVEDDDVQSIEISPAVTVADDDLCTITITEKFKDDWGDIGFVVNITNKSDKDLTFYAPSGKTNVNGTMKEPWFSAHLMPGTNATEEFTFSSGELDSLDDLVNTTIGIDAYLTDSYEDVASYSAPSRSGRPRPAADWRTHPRTPDGAAGDDPAAPSLYADAQRALALHVGNDATLGHRMHGQAHDVVVAGLAQDLRDAALDGALTHKQLGRDLATTFALAGKAQNR